MDDNNETEVSEILAQYLGHSPAQNTSQSRTVFSRFRSLVPPEAIIFFEYCLLRVPFLLLYDYLFTDEFSRSLNNFYEYLTSIVDQEKYFLCVPLTYILHSYAIQMLIEFSIHSIIPIIGLVLLIMLLLCSDRDLVNFYSYTISFLVIYFYYQMHRSTDIHINMVLLQIILSSIYIQMLDIRSQVATTSIQRQLCFIAPIIFLSTRVLLSLSVSVSIMNCYYFLWFLVHLSEVLVFQRESIIRRIRAKFLNALIREYENLGLQGLVDYLLEFIRVVSLLKIFWLAKILILPLGIRAMYTTPFLNQSELFDSRIRNDTLNMNESVHEKLVYNETLTKTAYFTMLYYGTETVFTLISLACLVSYGMKIISHRLFRFLHLWTEEVEQIGTVIGIMFFLLLFQSNLTRLDLNRRHVPLLKAFSLLIVALFHFLHTILEPQLLKVAMQTMTTRMAFNETNDGEIDDLQSESTISNNRNHAASTKFETFMKIIQSYHHHYVYTCVAIFVILIIYISLLWHFTTFSTWLLAITAFSLELIVRLTASIAQYTLYVLDAHNSLSDSESFDEYIFRIKAVTSCFEFILGVFLLFNGLYILFFEARGALRALMLAIHAYLNIIKNFRRGLQILRNRQSAWDNVNQLASATEDQINNYNDICAICHNTLTVGNTCVTPCAHLFHKTCLQKAFYATPNCALCSQTIVVERKNQTRSSQ